MNYFYTTKEIKQNFLSNTSAQHVQENLECNTYSNTKIIVDYKNETFGIFDINNKFIDKCIMHKNGHKHRIPKHIPTNIPYYDYDVVFCGTNTFHHFGHFLLEGLSRMWCIKEITNPKIKFLFIETNLKSQIPNFVKTLMNLLGVTDDRIIVLTKNASFRQIIIPDQGIIISSQTSKLLSTTFNLISSNITQSYPTYDKIYLSRCAMGPRKTYGEETIQKIFEQNGYKIIYPETLPISEQIGLVKNCKYLAGCAGTALHLAAFMQPGGTVIQLKRNSSINDNSGTQNLINKINDLNFILISASIEKEPTGHWVTTPQIIGVTKYLKQFFDDYKFVYTQHDTKHPKTVIQEYNNAYKKYKCHHIYSQIVKFFIRIPSQILPTKYLRKTVRETLTKLFRCD